jgi:flagellar motor switch protein FliN/FliY
MDASNPNFSLVLDVPLKLRMVIGSCHQSSQTLLRLGPGSVVTLDREPRGQISLFVGQKLVARGDIVMTESGPAVKVTELEPGNPHN